MEITLVSIKDVNTSIIETFTCTKEKYEEHEEKLQLQHKRIDEFLVHKALIYENEGLSRTHLLLNKRQDKVIGFFSLHNECIDFKRDFNKRVEKGVREQGLFPLTTDKISAFPSILLHYFAIDREFQGKTLPLNNIKYSTILLGNVFDLVKKVAELTGCMLLLLEATPNSINFYKENGFETFRETEILDPYNHMMFPLKDLLD